MTAAEQIPHTDRRPSVPQSLSNKILAHLKSQISLNGPTFLETKPFPYVVIDNFLPDDVCREMERYGRQLSALDSNTHLNSKKYANNRYWEFEDKIRDVVAFFYSEDFEHFLSDLTGIGGIQADYEFNWGGGYHVLPNDGFLNVHKDFNIHPHSSKHRRLNAIIYLNDDWTSEHGGQLELWDMDQKKRFENIVPIYNRCVIFETSEISYHGNPEKVKNLDKSRLSYSLYYYTDDRPDSASIRRHSTVYVDRPGEYKNFLRQTTRPVAKLLPVKLRAKVRDLLFR